MLANFICQVSVLTWRRSAIQLNLLMICLLSEKDPDRGRRWIRVAARGLHLLNLLPLLLLVLGIVVPRGPARVHLHVKLSFLPGKLVVLGLLVTIQAVPLKKKS